jgi:hypothetical protein
LTTNVVTQTEVSKAHTIDISSSGCLCFETLEYDVLFRSEACLFVLCRVEVRCGTTRCFVLVVTGTVSTEVACGTVVAVTIRWAVSARSTITESWALRTLATVVGGAVVAVAVGRTLRAFSAVESWALRTLTTVVCRTFVTVTVRRTITTRCAVAVGGTLATRCITVKARTLGTVTI